VSPLPERVDDLLPESGVTHILITLQADDHSLAARRRFCLIGSEDPVPPGDIEPEVVVRLQSENGMVNEVHVGSHDNASEKIVHPVGNLEVAVIEHGHAVEKDIELIKAFYIAVQQDYGTRLSL
jgi:hypothetical protein